MAEPFNSLDRTIDIISAYVTKNAVTSSDLPALIKSVYATLSGAQKVTETAVVSAAKALPAVPVKKSVTSDFIICLEDGLKFKSLRRHLLSKYGLSPDVYREKWGLPKDYPMVAPSYSASRSALAKASGFGVRASETAKKRPAKKTAVKA